MPCMACGIALPLKSDGRYCSAYCTPARQRGGTEGRSPRYPRRVCEVCDESYTPTYTRQRSCGFACGRFLRGGWPQTVVASPVDWRTCALCSRWYTIEGHRRCRCGLHCGRCGTAIPAGPRRYCDPCSPANARETRQRESASRRATVLAAVERVDPLKVAERDRWKCGLCGKRVNSAKRFPHPQAPTIDHVLPLARGGEHTYANVQLAHLRCNSRKKTGGSQQLALL